MAAAFGFVLAVLWLDMFWVRSSTNYDDLAGALRKRNWLNAFVAMGAVGAVGAAVLLWIWVGTCINGAF